MSTTSNGSESIVASVAKHEKELLSTLSASEEEARSIVEEARSAARTHLQDEENTLAQDIAETRRGAEGERQARFDATVNAAEERLVSVREESNRRVADTAQKVLSLFVPSGGAS